MTRYGIRHFTRFSYDTEISESIMELRMQPASEGSQQCLQFELQVEPRARVFGYRDVLDAAQRRGPSATGTGGGEAPRKESLA